LDQFDWADMVRWHCEAQRIQREQSEIAITNAQMVQLSNLAAQQAAVEEPPTDEEMGL
jgi:hypothetical protein